MNAETRPEPSPLKSLTASDDPLGVGALPDAAEEEKDDDGGEASIAELQSIRDLRLEREKMVEGGRGRPSARTLRMRARAARDLVGYLSPTADPSVMPPGYTPTSIVAYGCGTPRTITPSISPALQGEEIEGATCITTESEHITDVGASVIKQSTEKQNHEGREE